MSRRKQAKPRSLRRENTVEHWDDEGDSCAEGSEEQDDKLSVISQLSSSSISQHQDSDSGGESEAGSISEGSSISSCATPNSASSLQESDLSYTVGVTESTPYPCHFCNKAFPRLSYLKKHEQSHSEHMPFRCEFCLRLFKHKRSRDRHIKLHTGDKKYRCTKCEAAFSRSDHLKIHMKTHDNQKPFQCTICNRGYNTAAALTSHMQNHKRTIENQSTQESSVISSKLPNFKCLQCQDVFQKPEELMEHISSNHAESSTGTPSKTTDSVSKSVNGETGYNAVCPLCTISVPIGSLDSHMLTTHGRTRRNINNLQPILDINRWDSERQTLNKRPRISPINVENSLSQKRVEYSHPGVLLCSQCDAGYTDFESFRRHVQCHLEGRNHSTTTESNNIIGICPYCGKTPSTNENLIQHIGSHLLAPITDYGCNTCLRLFSSLDNLRRHLMDCHAFVAYRCCLCSDLFESKVAIEVHFTAKHCDEIKQYRCTACPSIGPLSSEPEFWLHVKTTHCRMNSPTHPGISSPRMLRCIFCSLTFSSELEMQYHLSVHTKQYQCQICSETFHVEYLLDKHMQSSHGAQNSTNKSEISSSAESSSSQIACNAAANSNTSNNDIASTSDKCTNDIQNNTNINNNNNNNNNKECGICEAGDFATEAELNAHRKLVHHLKTTSKLSLHCAYCKENCKSRNELEAHMKTHCHAGGGPGKHKCNICDELFNSAMALAEHKLTHCKVVHSTKCTQCKASLSDEETFTAHLGQHGSGTLPAACVICRQTLNTESEAMLHARLHLRAENNQPTTLVTHQVSSLIQPGTSSSAFRPTKEWPEEMANTWKSETMPSLSHLPLNWRYRPDLERHYKGTHILPRHPSPFLTDPNIMIAGYIKGKSESCRSNSSEPIESRFIRNEHEDLSYTDVNTTQKH